jgi:DNA polymerase-3 subunit alpha
MLEALPAAAASGERRRRDRAQGQGGLFDVLAADTTNEVAHHPAIGAEEFDSDVLLRFEKEALGLYVSSHPLQGLRAQLRDQIDATVSQLADLRDGQTVWTGGVISGLARRQTRSGATMAVFRLDDVDGGIEVVAFGSICEQYQDLLAEDGIVLVRGRLDRKSEDDVKLIALELRPFDGVSATRPLTLVVDAARVQMELLDELKSILGAFPGEVPVVLQMTTPQGRHRLKVGNKYRVDPVSGLYAELKGLLGESCVRVGR